MLTFHTLYGTDPHWLSTHQNNGRSRHCSFYFIQDCSQNKVLQCYELIHGSVPSARHMLEFATCHVFVQPLSLCQILFIPDMMFPFVALIYMRQLRAGSHMRQGHVLCGPACVEGQNMHRFA